MKKKKVLLMITAGMLMCVGCHGQNLKDSQENISVIQEESVPEENEAGRYSEPEDQVSAVNEKNTEDSADTVNEAASGTVDETAPVTTKQSSEDAMPTPGTEVIEGVQFADGREVPVKISMTLEQLKRGEEAYKILANADSNIAVPGSDEEYIIFTFAVSYNEGEADEIYLTENRASLEGAGLYFALSNGDSNAEDMTSCLSNGIYDLVISKGASAKGEVAFLHKIGADEPLHFVGFGKDTIFTFEKAYGAGAATESSQTNGAADTSEDVSVQKSVERAIVCGQIGDLGIGYLVYSISGQSGEDYRLYFVESEDRQVPLSEVDINLEEAKYVFPDVRAGNAPIGDFSDIYYEDAVDMTGDGRAELLIIARYDKEGRKYFDTRVYEINENGIGVNYDLIRELNEKYCDVEEYPVEEVKKLHL